jgi:hypothetical protein
VALETWLSVLYLSLGFPEKHFIGVLKGLFEGSGRVCGQLWPLSSVDMHMDSSILCSIHASVTIKHSKVGTIYRVLMENTVVVTDPPALHLTEAGALGSCSHLVGQ